MAAIEEIPSGAHVLHLAGELTIFRAGELKALLLGTPLPTEVDLAGITEIDTAGLQLLVLARQTAQAAQRDFRLVNHSEAVTELFDLLHLGAHFGEHVGDPMPVDTLPQQSRAQS